MAGSEHGFGGAERKNTIKTESLKILLNKKQFTNFDLNQALSNSQRKSAHLLDERQPGSGE